MAPSLVPELPPEEMPALVLGRGYGSHATQLLKPEPSSQQARSPVTSTAAPAPMYQSMKGWHVLWKRLPVPAPSPPSRRDAKHTLWQADDSMTQTYIQRGLRHVGCSLSTSLTL